MSSYCYRLAEYFWSAESVEHCPAKLSAALVPELASVPSLPLNIQQAKLAAAATTKTTLDRGWSGLGWTQSERKNLTFNAAAAATTVTAGAAGYDVPVWRSQEYRDSAAGKVTRWLAKWLSGWALAKLFGRAGGRWAVHWAGRTWTSGRAGGRATGRLGWRREDHWIVSAVL